MKTLARSLSPFENLLITVSGLTPCCSLFLGLPVVMQMAGTGALWSFFGAAVLSACMALVYAEVGSAYPLSGLGYAIAGRVLGRFPSFILLGQDLVSTPLTIAAMSISISAYLQPVLPGLSPIGVGVASTAVCALVAILKIQINSFITGVFLALELAVLLVLTVLGFAHPARPLWHMVLHPVAASAGGALLPASVAQIALAMPIAFCCFNGFQFAITYSEETTNARRNVARVVIWALAIGVIAEMTPLVAMLWGVPDLHLLGGDTNSLLPFIETRGGHGLAVFAGVSVALAQFNANIAIMLMFARLLYSTGRDRIWPARANRLLTRLHVRFASPWAATLVAGVVACAACFINLTTLLIITGSSVVVAYGGICLSALWGRRNGSTAHAPYRMPLYPLAPLMALAGLVYVTFATYQDKDSGRPSLYAAAILILASVVYYFLAVRPRGQWVLAGPPEETLPAAAGAGRQEVPGMARP